MANQNPDMPGGQELTIVNENIEVQPNGRNRRGRAVPPLMEDDDTFRAWTPQVLRYVTTNPNGDTVVKEIIALSETNGRPTTMLYGQDSAGNQDRLYTNDDRHLVVGEGAPIVAVHDPIELTNTDAIILNPGAQVIIWMFVSNFSSSAAAVVDIGIDVNATAGAVTDAGGILRNYRLVPGENTGWMGPFNLTADDNLRGNADANSVANIHLVRRASVIV